MRQTIAVLLAIFLLVPAAPARTPGDWSSVEKLTADAPLVVALWTGERIRGHFLSASDDALRLAAYDLSIRGSTYLREIGRAEIRKVELVRRDQNLPNPNSWAVRGALIGGTIGVGLGIHRDITESSACEHACWLVDGAAAAGLGAMAGLISSGFVGIGHIFRHNKLIYEGSTPQRTHFEH